MGIRKPFAAVLLCCFLAVAAAMPAEHVEPAQDGTMSTYIVHVASSHSPRTKRNAARLTRAYTSFLRDTLPTGIHEPAPTILYSYARAMTGFAARLTARQAARLEAQPSILAVTPDRIHELHTTLSSSFLGLTPNSPLMMESNSVTDVVIGVLDTGIYPKDRASFAADPSLKGPPRCFRGGCVSTPDFNATEYCNNKLVGAKFFQQGQRAMTSHMIGSAPASGSPLDYNGHGTHTASTAAGAPVSDASLFGFGSGIAKGTASGARIASYNVCDAKGRCPDSDVLAGIDEAIADKVDVLSISLGGGSPENLYGDALYTATFRAVREGIFVSTSAGNRGPGRTTVGNVAPWVLTVGASSMNRQFWAPVNLGNGKSFFGYSLYSGQDPYGTMKPLVYGGDVGSTWCQAGKLEPSKVAGKIVLCDVHGRGVDQGYAVKQAGGVGAIISSTASEGEYGKPEAHLLPAATVSYADAMEIRKYSSTPSPTASFSFFSTLIGTKKPPSPRVASFSSRGPNRVAPEILKPDVIAPGVDILAAWTGETPLSTFDTRRVKFNIISGTSMAAPQVSGIAALLKVARPKWSPAAIKSALMTTAYNLDNTGEAITDMSTGKKAGPFELGAGHVNPNRALDPGLVYDADEDDYISFLCALGYTTDQIAMFTESCKKEDICSEHKNVTVGDHNYPAFSVAFKSYTEKVTQRRVVRNVGSNVDAVYTFSLRSSLNNVTVDVYPGKLVFDAQHQTLEYTLTFSTTLSATNNSSPQEENSALVLSDGQHEMANPANNSSPQEEHSALVLSDGQHEVVSPMVFTWPAPTAAAATM
ncbi:unnamed protein product [Alopecurus aequalis]